MTSDKTIYSCLSLAFLISSFSLTMPYLQSRRDELQCDSFCQGSLTSLRSVLSLLGSALMGRFSDYLSQTTSKATFTINESVFNRITRSQGRSLCLYIGNLASFIGLVLSITIPTRNGLWWSMIPGALFQQNFSVFKAILAEYYHQQSDTSGDAASLRAANMGKLGMSVGLAFMIGPLLGALLVSNFSHAVYLAMIMIVLSTVLIQQVPSSPTKKDVPHLTTTQEPSKVSSSSIRRSYSITDTFRVLWSQSSFTSIQTTWSLLFSNHTDTVVPAWRSSPALFLMMIRMCMALAFHIFQLIWTISLKRRFNFGPSDHGKFMSFIGLVYALSQGFVAKRIIRTVKAQNRVRVLQLCCIILGLGRYLAFQTNRLMIVYCLFGAIVTCLGVMNTILTSDTSNIAPAAEIGALYGILESVESASGILGPFVGGYIQHPLICVLMLYVIVFLLVTFGYECFIIHTRVDLFSKKNV